MKNLRSINSIQKTTPKNSESASLQIPYVTHSVPLFLKRRRGRTPSGVEWKAVTEEMHARRKKLHHRGLHQVTFSV